MIELSLSFNVSTIIMCQRGICGLFFAVLIHIFCLFVILSSAHSDEIAKPAAAAPFMTATTSNRFNITPNNQLITLPPIFDFNVYKRTFHKHYATAIAELRRKALFVASCLKVLPMMAAFRVGIASYSAGLNWDSDLTREERRTRRAGVNRGRRPTQATANNVNDNNIPARVSKISPRYGERKSIESLTDNIEQYDDAMVTQDSSRKRRRLMKSPAVKNRPNNNNNDIDYNLLDSNYVSDRLLNLLDNYRGDNEMYETILDYANDITLAYESVAHRDDYGDFLAMVGADDKNNKKRARDFVTQSSLADVATSNAQTNDGESTTRTIYKQLLFAESDERLDNDYDYGIDPPDLSAQRKLRSNNKSGVTDELDWSQHECMMPAINQGLCGSCYAHSSVSLLEFHLCKKKLLDVGETLSRELVLDCGPAYSDALTGCESGESNVTLNMLTDMGMFWRQQDYEHFYTTTVIERQPLATLSTNSDSDKKRRVSPNDSNKSNTNDKDNKLRFIRYQDRLSEDRWFQDRCIFDMSTRAPNDLGDDIEDWVVSQNGHGFNNAGSNEHDENNNNNSNNKYRLIKDSISFKSIVNSGDYKRRLRYGPIGIQMYFPDEASDYSEGIFDGVKCLKDAKEDRYLHAMVMVGYGRSNGLDYYIIRNSWGPDWGIRGNIKVATTVPRECFAYGFYLVDAARPKDQLIDDAVWRPTKAIDGNDISQELNDDNVRHQMLAMLSGLNLYDITLAAQIETGAHSR